jgi:arylsulfatase A-like enzyme
MRHVCLAAALLALLAGLAGCGGTDRALAPADLRPEIHTAASPDVDRLRQSVRGANVVFVVLDAARADHAGCYGYERDITPNIDALARQGMLFENHFVQFPETKLAQGFKEIGYHTALFSQNDYASPQWGLGTHFDTAVYEPDLRKAGYERPFYWLPQVILEQVEGWLEDQSATPFFAYVHFMPPHDPYLAPREIYSRFLQVPLPESAWRAPYPFEGVEVELRARERPWDQALFINRYDGHYFFGDMAVGALAGLFHEAGLLDNTLFIVSADHGEAFGEHGYKGHTTSVYDESIHVPLVMKFPGDDGPRGRIEGFTEVVDMLPTLAALFLFPYPKDVVQGRSFLPLLAGQEEEIHDYVFSRSAGDPPSYAVRSKDWLLMLYSGGEMRALYDLKSDPRAVENVIEEEPEQAEHLYQVFREFAQRQTAEWPDVELIEPTEDMLDTLRALGYVK